MLIAGLAVREIAVDGAALAKAWALSVQGLIGPPGAGSIIGMHLSEPRSPERGAIGQVSIRPGGRAADPVTGRDSVPTSFAIKAVGGEDGAHRQAERACRNLVNALHAMERVGPIDITAVSGKAPQQVTQTARLWAVHTVYGPTLGGNVGGEVTYRADAVFVWQLPSAIHA